jgi:hypothetical protein
VLDSPGAVCGRHGTYTPRTGAFLRTLLYLDAGSGSMILQILLGGLAAVGVMAKFYWRRLLTFLRIRKPDEADAPSPH